MRKTNTNNDIRAEMENAGVYQWQVADKLGIHAITFTCKLRHELTDEEKANIRTIIEELKKA